MVTPPAVNATVSTPNASALTVNAGGIFELNGNSQAVGNFSSAGTLPGTGGIVKNTSTNTATFTVITSSAQQDFAGQISSADASKSAALSISATSR